MRKLNLKNKLFIIVFSIIILIIVVLLVIAVRLAGHQKKSVYDVNNNTILFSSDSNLIDTNLGGKIEKRWNGDYYFLSSKNNNYALGYTPVVYDSSIEIITVFGRKYQILLDGSINYITDDLVISDVSKPTFYKLDDRVYLIASREIYNTDKSIYASNYLIVYIDKQGNASLLNDSINIKTINPLKLTFGDYLFDVANEKLLIDESILDLKLVIGSTNEYVASEKKDIINYDSKKLVDSYNKLVNNFSQYEKNQNIAVSSNNLVNYNNNSVINYNSNKGSSSSNNNLQAKNKTNINKRVSLRGAVSNTSYIDVSYVVTDPEEKYQAVYLLVSGNINGENTTQKIILDKYDTSYRIFGLNPNNEYSISLGDIEVITEDDGENKLVDNIEDVINIRTLKIQYQLSVNKISSGYVYFKFKMPSSYALESGNIVLYCDGVAGDSIVPIDYKAVISEQGFSSRIPLMDGSLYELKVENGIHNNEVVNFEINKKFQLPS